MVSVMDKQLIPAGYKQTEVGVIPEDWKVSTVGTEFEVKLGKMLDSEKNVGAEKPYLGNKSVKWGNIDVEDLQTMRMTQADLKEYRLRIGDLLVCEGGEVGRSGIWKGGIDECYYQKALHRLRSLRGFEPSLMLAYFRYWTDQSLIDDYVSQTSIAHLTREKLVSIPMPVPSAKEQTAIANALSDVDALIAALEKLINKKSAIKTAAMQQLLTGKKRLPPFDQLNTGYKQTELGEIPGDWEVVELRSALSIHHGRDQKKIEVIDGDFPILATGGEIGRTNSFLFNRASVLIGRKGTINKPRFIDSPFWTVDTLFYSEIKSRFDEKFVYYKFCLIDWMSYNEASGVPSLNASTIENISQIFPCNKDEQTAIANVLSDMDNDLEALQQRLHKTQQIKQGMMQELLTGKTRLISGISEP